MTKPIVVITGADTPTGLTTVRSLRDHPVVCWGVAEDRRSVCCSSRYWSHIEILTGIPSEQVGCLVALGHKALRLSGQKPLLLFSQDEWVLRASENRDLLNECFKMVIPDHQSLLILMDKTRFHEWAACREYALPKTLTVGSKDELCRAASEMPVPFVVKPLVRTRQWDEAYINHKFITCSSGSDAKELQNNAERLMTLSSRYVLQEWIAGEDEDVVFCLLCADEHGRILDVFTGRKLWQWPPLEGSTAVCTDFDSPEIESESIALMMNAGHKGLGSLEFKFNRNNGRYQITEPTVGRNDYQSLVAVCAGHNLTGRLVESVFDLPAVNKAKSRRVIWIDEMSALRRARVKKLGFLKLLKWMFQYSMVRKCFLMFDFRDLKPFKTRLRRIFNKLGKKFFNYTIDAFFVFKTRLDDRTFENETGLPEGYSVRVVRSDEDPAFPRLCDLWRKAYYQGVDVRRDVIEGVVKGLFRDGDLCCCLFYRDTLVGMDWLGFSQAIRRMNFTSYLKGESSSSVGHHIYIIPSHRGRSLQLITDDLRKKVAREQGAVSQYLFVGVKNFASVRNMMKCNQHYKLIYHAKVDIPYMQINLFPGRHFEQWTPCEAHGRTPVA